MQFNSPKLPKIISHSILGKAIISRDIKQINDIIINDPSEINSIVSRQNNALSITALGCAICIEDNEEIIKFLIQKGSDVNSFAFLHDNSKKLTPIDFAVHKNKPDLMRILLDLGADFSKYDNIDHKAFISPEISSEIENFKMNKVVRILIDIKNSPSTEVQSSQSEIAKALLELQQTRD